MNYWMIALPKERLEYCLRVGIFGLNRKYILGKLKQADKVVFYATKDRQIIALGEVTEEYYVDDKRIFNDRELFPGDDLFPDRIKFTASRLHHEVDFIPIIDRMSFIKSLANWQIHFRSGIVQISKADWDVIVHETDKRPA